MKTLGQLIKEKRLKKGLLLREVASMLEMDQAVLCKIEKGQRRPTLDKLSRLSEILDVSEEELKVEYYSEKIVYEIIDERCASKALDVAEKKLKYLKSKINGKI